MTIVKRHKVYVESVSHESELWLHEDAEIIKSRIGEDGRLKLWIREPTGEVKQL